MRWSIDLLIVKMMIVRIWLSLNMLIDENEIQGFKEYKS